MKTNILILLLLIGGKAFCQDLQSVQRLIATNDYTAAKTQIDQILSDKKQWPEAANWFYKGKVYTEYSRQQNSEISSDLLKQAFEAFRRYQELDPKNRLMQVDNNIGLFQLYDLNYNTGINLYNEQGYAKAFYFFRNALEIEDYATKRGFSFQGQALPAADTSLINLAGSSAYLAANEEEAIPYFERLVDMKVRGEDYKGVYALLAQYYLKRNNTAKGEKYLSLGRELYPDREYWIRLSLANATGKDRFSRYDELLVRYPDHFKLAMDYAIELYNYVYSDKRPADAVPRGDRLQEVLLKALSLDGNSLMANYVMSQHLHNQLYYLDDSLHQVKEEAGKKAMMTRIDQKYEELYRYSKKAFDLYTANPGNVNKENYKKLISQLVNYHQHKNQPAQAAEYEERLKGL